LLAGCMTHNDAYEFIRVGRNLERADMTTRIVDAGLVHLLPANGDTSAVELLMPYNNVLWMSVLRSLSAYQMYRQHVRDRVNAKDVVTFLLQNESFPRALAHSLAELEGCLKKLPNSKAVVSTVGRVREKVLQADIGLLLESGLHEYIDDVQAEIGQLHSQIAGTWFDPVAIARTQRQTQGSA